MQARSITYNEFDPQKLILSAPQKKSVPNQPNTFYSEVPIQYNYGSSEQPILGDLLVEFPELYSNGGIATNEDPGKKKSYSIYTEFPEQEQTLSDLVQRDRLIYASIALQLNQIKGQVGLVNFMVNLPGQTEFNFQMSKMLLRPVIDYPADKMTGAVIPGKASRAWLKPFRRGFGARKEETLFTGLDAQKIPWELLAGVEMRFIPLYHYKKVYVGTKASIQAEIVSAVVTNVIAKNSKTTQVDTIARYNEQHKDALTQLQEQLAMLQVERQATMLADTPSNQPGSQFGGQGTGLMQQIDQGTGQQPNMQQGFGQQNFGQQQQQGFNQQNFGQQQQQPQMSGFVTQSNLGGYSMPTLPQSTPQTTNTPMGIAPVSGLDQFMGSTPMNLGQMVGLPTIPVQTPNRQESSGVMKFQ